MAKDEVKEAKLEVKAEKGDCPFCKSQSKKSTLVREREKLQCLTCGKLWEDSAIGKEYSIELERGENWAVENQIRQLQKR